MRSIIIVLLIFIIIPLGSNAQSSPDTDQDGISNDDEIKVYHTDPNNADTDGDGFSDWMELNQGFSPWEKGSIKLEKGDFDKDGLSDRMELNFHIDPTDPDTDGDGYKDGDEIKRGFDPSQKEGVKMKKKIEVDLKQQKAYWFYNDVRMGGYRVSTGKRSMPTPKGNFKILNKVSKAWSKKYGLWMPYWMGLGEFGFHELPIWPSGYREGANHLGIPVSHGCIRLGIGPAAEFYKWAEVGTVVKIY